MPLSPPAAPGDFPDPYVVRVDDGWAAFATNAGGRNVQVRWSADLRAWEDRPDALPELGRWAVPGWTWSPAVTGRSGHWVLWYVAREPRSGRQAISVATAPRWDGPYRDASPEPVLFQADEGGSIDPSVFEDGDGSRYLLWKADANALGRPSSLWGAPLDPTATALAGPPVRLLVHDRAWERPLVEAPSLFVLDGRYWLAYSGGWWESARYGMGLAVGDAPLGPYTKLTVQRPWVGGDRFGSGPGGQEIFTADDGSLLVAYHAWAPGRVGYALGGARSLRIGRIGVPPGPDAAPPAGWRQWLHRAPDPALPTVGP